MLVFIGDIAKLGHLISQLSGEDIRGGRRWGWRTSSWLPMIKDRNEGWWALDRKSVV